MCAYVSITSATSVVSQLFFSLCFEGVAILSKRGCFLCLYFPAQLSVTTLALFYTLLGLNCEDVMLELAFRYVSLAVIREEESLTSPWFHLSFSLSLSLSLSLFLSNTYTHSHTHARMHTHAHTRARAHTHTHTHTHIYADMHCNQSLMHRGTSI